MLAAVQHIRSGRATRQDAPSSGYQMMLVDGLEDPGKRLGPCLTKSEVLRWFLHDATPRDASWVLGCVRSHRPELLSRVVRQRPEVRLASPRTVDPTDEGRCASMHIEIGADEEELMEAVRSQRERLTSGFSRDVSVVQFAAATYFASEGDEDVILTVLRIGNLDGACSVSYSTRGVSAVAGRNFEDARGNLTFAPGESTAEIRVGIYNNGHWNNTVEFQVLLAAESCQGCMLEQFLSEARVKVIDDGVFPSDRCKVAAEEGDLGNLSEFTLFYHYCKLCWQDPVIWSGSIRLVSVDLLHRLHHGMKLLANAYLVDKVLKNPNLTDDAAAARLQLLACALVWVLPMGLLHFLDYTKATWMVPGRCRAFLQNALFCKFLDYDDFSRAEQAPGSTIMAVTRDVQTLVDQGYLSTLSLVQALCAIASMVIFKLIGNKLFGVAISPALVVSLVAFPAIILPYVYLRRNTMAHYLHTQFRAQDVMADTVASTVDGLRLLIDYHQQTKRAAEFSQNVVSYNKATIDVVQITANNDYFVQWIGALVVGFYTFVRGYMVLQGECSLGIYLMDIHIFLHVRTAFGSLFQALMSITSVKPTLERITRLLNLPTRLASEKSVSTGRAMVSRIAMGLADNRPDEIPIRLRCPKYSYKSRMFGSLQSGIGSSASSTSIQLDGDIELAQGQLIAISGPPAQGKSTVLKMLAGVIRAEDSDVGSPAVFVPSHLRALHVPIQPLFFFGTLLENLTHGLPATRPQEEERARVREICSRLGVEDRAMRFLDSSVTMEWCEVFSFSQLCLLNLARALVFNPEILCISYPAIAFSEEVRANVFKVLREWVAQRGVAVSDSSYHLRRPRTCLYTVMGRQGVLAADRVLNISCGGLHLLESKRTQSGSLEGGALAEPEDGPTGGTSEPSLQGPEGPP